MMLVRQLLDSKGRDVLSIAPHASVYEAVALMAEHSIGALLVVDYARLVGVLSERDYARKVILQDRASKTTTVGEIMSSPVITGRESQTVSECMALMTERRIRHLPIVEDGQVTGVISIGDLVKAIIADQQFVIAQLETYITS
ncbi:MAG: CBS domain-containing protein [Gammaproteobacteria bacterium]